MKLSSLLDHHRKFANHAGAVQHCFGDGFLVAKNRIYGSIRDQAVKLGYKFSSTQNDAYRALPLSQLDYILESKIIPYVDNVTVLESIEERIPKQTSWNDISDNLKGNSVFHEACHGVARDHFAEIETKLRARADLKPQDATVLRMLLEESFANASELLSIVDVEDQAHRIFLELNSYVYMLNDRVHLNNAVKDVGLNGLARLLLLSYLFANFLKEPSSSEIDRMMRLSFGDQVPNSALKNLRQLTRIAQNLNPRFREVTTSFYLRLNGVKGSPAEVLSFDFLTALEKIGTFFMPAAPYDRRYE